MLLTGVRPKKSTLQISRIHVQTIRYKGLHVTLLQRSGKPLHGNTVACMESWPDVERPREERRRSSAIPLNRLKCKKFKVLTGGYDGNICLLSVTEMEERVIARQLVSLMMMHFLPFQATQHSACLFKPLERDAAQTLERRAAWKKNASLKTMV